jgi:phage terminase large subunit
MRPILVENNG